MAELDGKTLSSDVGAVPGAKNVLSPLNLPVRTPSLERRIAEILRTKGDQVNQDVRLDNVLLVRVGFY